MIVNFFFLCQIFRQSPCLFCCFIHISEPLTFGRENFVDVFRKQKANLISCTNFFTAGLISLHINNFLPLPSRFLLSFPLFCSFFLFLLYFPSLIAFSCFLRSFPSFFLSSFPFFLFTIFFFFFSLLPFHSFLLWNLTLPFFLLLSPAFIFYLPFIPYFPYVLPFHLFPSFL